MPFEFWSSVSFLLIALYHIYISILLHCSQNACVNYHYIISVIDKILCCVTVGIWYVMTGRMTSYCRHSTYLIYTTRQILVINLLLSDSITKLLEELHTGCLVTSMLLLTHSFMYCTVQKLCIIINITIIIMSTRPYVLIGKLQVLLDLVKKDWCKMHTYL